MIMDTLYKKLLLLTMAIVLGQSVAAQEKVSKTITEDFSMTNAGQLHLENKYGTVNLYGWDKDNISISVVITASHRKKQNAEDLLKRIRPVINDAENFVDISYEIAEKSDGFFAKYFNKANPFDFDRSNIQIDYTIYLPKKAELDINNKFGDVLIEDWKGKLRANVEHGDIWINEDLAKADVDLSYGKLRGQSIAYGAFRLKNGGLNMANAQSLRINSSGSYINIDNVSALEFYSNKDEVTIEEAGNIYGTLKFTNVKIGLLTKDIDLTMKIADFRVDQITNPKSVIAIEQESSEVSLNIAKFPHQFNAILEQGLVRLPKSFTDVESTMLDKGRRIREIDATYGKQPEGKITITGKKGIVLLKEL